MSATQHASTRTHSSRTARRLPSRLLSGYLSMCATLALIWLFPSLSHWFIMPTMLCAMLIGSDAIDWFRGDIDVFDLRGIIGLFGVYFFSVAPILHVTRDYWIRNVVPPDDWRTWLGYMACLNAVGIVAYQLTRRWAIQRASAGSARYQWTLSTHRFTRLVIPALVITGGVQLAVYLWFGGISGFVSVATAPVTGEGGQPFAGFGVVFAIADSFPLVLMMGIAVHAMHRQRPMSWLTVLGIVVLMFLLYVLFGGLRANRSQIVYAMFWTIGIIHYSIRPVHRRFIVTGVLALVAFSYLYGFYKGAGTEGIAAIYDAERRQIVEETTRRDINLTLLGDFGRSDVQAYTLYRVVSDTSDYELALGRTYLGTLAYLIPHQMYPDRPPTKIKEGTHVLYGEGAYDSGTRSLRIFGLAGETMLNFGVIVVPLAFAIFGILVGTTQRWLSTLPPHDARWLIAPIVVNGVFISLFQDSDVVFAYFVFSLTVPLVLVWLSSFRATVQ